jgi:hypothetical protein
MCGGCFARQRALVALKKAILETDTAAARAQAAFVVRSSVDDVRNLLRNKADAVNRGG